MQSWHTEWELPGGSEWWDVYPEVKNEVLDEEIDAVLAKEAYELIVNQWDPGQDIPDNVDRLVEGEDSLIMEDEDDEDYENE